MFSLIISRLTVGSQVPFCSFCVYELICISHEAYSIALSQCSVPGKGPFSSLVPGAWWDFSV